VQPILVQGPSFPIALTDNKVGLR